MVRGFGARDVALQFEQLSGRQDVPGEQRLVGPECRRVLQFHDDRLGTRLIPVGQRQIGGVEQTVRAIVRTGNDAVRKRLNESNPATDHDLINTNVGRVEVHPTQIVIRLARKRDRTTNRKSNNAILYVPWKKTNLKRRREIIAPAVSNQDVRPIRSETRLALVTSIACGRRWLDEIVAGVADVEQIAAREKCSVRQVNMTISLAFLSPTLVKAAIDGRLPRGIGIARLRDAPAEWSKQHAMLGLSS
jgi:hypothetical protein